MAGAILGLAGLFGGPAVAATSPNDPAIVVGMLLTLSGPQGLAGQDMLDGFNLALKEIGSRFSNQEVRVVVADDKGSPDTAQQALQRLLARDRLDVVVTGVSSGSLAAVMPALAAHRLFVLNLRSAPPAMAGAGCSHWMFDLGGEADGVHEAAGAQMAADKIKRVVMVGPDTPQTAEAAAALKRTFPGEVAAVLLPEHGATTFAAELARIRAAEPDAVYTILTGGMAVEFVHAWDVAGMRAVTPLYAAWPGFERPFLPAMGEAAMDVTTLGTWSPDIDTPLNRRLVSEFESEYGRPATTWAAEAFDAVYLLDGALKTTQGRTTDPDAVRAGLRRAEFPSVRGLFRFATNQFAILTFYSRKIARDSKGRPGSEIRGVALKDWRGHGATACPMRWEEIPPPQEPKAKKKG